MWPGSTTDATPRAYLVTAAVSDLHRPVRDLHFGDTVCCECARGNQAVVWPCATARALGAE